jgi:hypothetical protein
MTNSDKPEPFSLADAAQRASAKGVSPDLKDAVTKWDKPGVEMSGPPATDKNGKPYGGNLSKTLFYTIAKHPKIPFEKLFLLMADQGYETQRASMSPLLTMMVKQGMIRREDGMYSAMQKEYSPLAGRSPTKQTKPAKKLAKKPVAKPLPVKKAPAPVAKKATAKKAVLQSVTKTAPAKSAKNEPATVPYTISDATLPLLIEHMTIKQARAMYLMLSKMFA